MYDLFKKWKLWKRMKFSVHSLTFLLFPEICVLFSKIWYRDFWNWFKKCWKLWKAGGGSATKFRLFSYDDLKVASDGFSSKNKVGEGGFGSVYKVIFLLHIYLYFLNCDNDLISFREIIEIPYFILKPTRTMSIISY